MSKDKTGRLLETYTRKTPKGYSDYSEFRLYGPPSSPDAGYALDFIVKRVVEMDQDLKCAAFRHAETLDLAGFTFHTHGRDAWLRRAVEKGQIKRKLRADRDAWLALLRPHAKDLRKALSLL